MTWFRMPLFPWATYATSIIQVLAMPVLGIVAVAIAERTTKIGIFDPNTMVTRSRSSISSGLQPPSCLHHDFAASASLAI